MYFVLYFLTALLPTVCYIQQHLYYLYWLIQLLNAVSITTVSKPLIRIPLKLALCLSYKHLITHWATHTCTYMDIKTYTHMHTNGLSVHAQCRWCKKLPRRSHSLFLFSLWHTLHIQTHCIRTHTHTPTHAHLVLVCHWRMRSDLHRGQQGPAPVTWLEETHTHVTSIFVRSCDRWHTHAHMCSLAHTYKYAKTNDIITCIKC